MNKENRKYYEAYDERYKQAHQKGVSWENMVNTPIVLETIKKYKISKNHKVLEIGCGEGRDSLIILEKGYDLLATDISKEAITYCKEKYPDYKESFCVLDCLSNELKDKYDFIYAIAVIHMLVLDDDRNKFYSFVYDHLNEDGIALICSMGDGIFEMKSDIENAFEIQERNHPAGKMMVASTTCRMVSFSVFEEEIARNGLKIIEKGITNAMPNFNSLMYAVVTKRRD